MFSCTVTTDFLVWRAVNPKTLLNAKIHETCLTAVTNYMYMKHFLDNCVTYINYVQDIITQVAALMATENCTVAPVVDCNYICIEGQINCNLPTVIPAQPR